MAKHLRSILEDKRLEGVNKSTKRPGSTGKDPGVDYAPKAPSDQEFVSDHETQVFADRVGNTDVPYTAPTVKQALLKPDEKKHGNTQAKAKVAYKSANEDVEQIDEIGDTDKGRSVLKNYIKKAGGGSTNSAVAHQAMSSDAAPGGQLHKTSVRKSINRVKGVERAVDRLEAVECNNTEEGVACGVHGEAACPDMSGKKKLLLDKNKKVEEASQYRSTFGMGKRGWASSKAGKITFQDPQRLPSPGPKKADLRADAAKAMSSGKAITKLPPGKAKGLKEEEQIDEVITKKTPVSTIIKDFIHSDDPKFAGKSKKERQRMALGAYYGKHPEKSRNEEVEVAEDLAVPMLEGGKKKKTEKESAPGDTPIKFPSGNVGDMPGRV